MVEWCVHSVGHDMTAGNTHDGAIGATDDVIEVDLLGRRVSVLDISRELGPDIPIYPGHVGVAFWDHLTHEQVRRQRLPGVARSAATPCVASSPPSTSPRTSTPIWHFNRDRPDLTIDKVGFDQLITPAAWIDVSDVAPQTHITRRPRAPRARRRGGRAAPRA